jgi:hypothetical protein
MGCQVRVPYVKLIKLRSDCLLPLWPFWGGLCLLQAVMPVSGLESVSIPFLTPINNESVVGLLVCHECVALVAYIQEVVTESASQS